MPLRVLAGRTAGSGSPISTVISICYDGETSPTGEAADMPISVVLGRGPKAWVEAAGGTSDPTDVTLLGPRDLEEALTYGHPHPDEIPGLSFVDAEGVRREGPAVVGQTAADRISRDAGTSGSISMST